MLSMRPWRGSLTSERTFLHEPRAHKASRCKRVHCENSLYWYVKAHARNGVRKGELFLVVTCWFSPAAVSTPPRQLLSSYPTRVSQRFQWASDFLRCFTLEFLHSNESNMSCTTPARTVFDNDDLSVCIAQYAVEETGLRTWNATRAVPTRSHLRLVHAAARRQVDGLCEAYEDTRHCVFRRASTLQDVDASASARQALAAIALFPRLRELKLEGLDEAAVELLAHGVPDDAPASLRTLSLVRGTFETLSLPAAWAGVTELDLSGCGALDDASLEAATSGLPGLQRLRLTMNAKLCFPQLSCPRLLAASISICAHLEDRAVDHLIARAPLLQELCLWRCASLRAPAVAALHLTALNLSDCFELADEAVEAACTGCPKLQRLQLAGCANVQAPRVLGGCATRTLDVSDVRLLEDATLSEATAACPNLVRLDCSGCALLHTPKVGGSSMLALLMSRCDTLTDAAVSQARHFPFFLPPLLSAVCPPSSAQQLPSVKCDTQPTSAPAPQTHRPGVRAFAEPLDPGALALPVALHATHLLARDGRGQSFGLHHAARWRRRASLLQQPVRHRQAMHSVSPSPAR